MTVKMLSARAIKVKLHLEIYLTGTILIEIETYLDGNNTLPNSIYVILEGIQNIKTRRKQSDYILSYKCIEMNFILRVDNTLYTI